MLFQITVMVLQTPKGAFKKKVKLEFKSSETLVKSFFNKCVLAILVVISDFIVLLYILFLYGMFLLSGGFIEIKISIS